MGLSGFPTRQGLYDPRNEHDACGVGFVCDIKNRKSHDIIAQGLELLENLTHRGAVGADPKAGDGAGILLQMPHAFLQDVTDFELPAAGDYAVGALFLPRDDDARRFCEEAIEKYTQQEGQSLLGWRDIPVDNSHLGESVLPTEPVMRQVFIGRGESCADQDAFERKLFVIRKQLEFTIYGSKIEGAQRFYVTSLSSRLLSYKGLLLAGQVGFYFQDLRDERMTSALALVHQRFATNTFPTWELAQPFRMIAHNGEINTLRGNANWMAARKHSMKSELFGEDMDKLWPIIREGQSDSASFDNALELLVLGGYSMGHAMMMLIPEAWSGNDLMDPSRRSFYEFHAALMEPWDGPAAVAFTDGRQIGATLDRNGLRPARYLITSDDRVVMASEMGVLPIPEDKIVKKWRLQPGKMFLIDLEQGCIIDNAQLKTDLSSRHPYQDWLDKTQIHLKSLPVGIGPMAAPPEVLLNRQQAFGFTQEDLKFLMTPMAATGMEAIGSMGADNPPAVLSSKAKPLANYFKQNFAQVTNPPIDPIREEIVMSLVSLIGPRPNLLGRADGGSNMRLEVTQPILTNRDLERIRAVEGSTGGAFKTRTVSLLYPVFNGAEGMEPALKNVCKIAEEAVNSGFNIITLSDRRGDADSIAIPALLATSAVHQHLIRKGLRTETGLVVETGTAREVHHFATLAGYGAEAINPYLAFETLTAAGSRIPEDELHAHYIKAIGKGLHKVMSKMGISTYQSYCGAQIFDAVGLSSEFVDQYFTGTATTIEGVGIREIAKEAVRWHQNAYGNKPIYKTDLDVGGDYAQRIRGEDHVWTSETISALQHATRSNDGEKYKEFAKIINEQNERLLTFRGLFNLRFADKPIPLEEVEPASEIVKRFSTGAMSFGSISYEAHTTLAIAMNQLGGKSNTGEGGELRERYLPLEDGSSNPKRSAIKQVASGRFGVTIEYLVNADDIQIKMAQGAKPGEGGQLPGHKVDQTIATVRHSTPGVGLISPPPHHDIYSIEDLAQLIHDLKNTNPKARISVKLVSEVGVGTVAAGVTKAHADHITISGYDGGTGASPLTSIKHAGSSWEIGLAETHQTLLLNNLRGRVAVQVDGGLRTGRDVVVGALLGADEFGFATAPLIVEGCLMMRKCHLNTCPVGIATQDPVLRKRFTGQAEHVVNYFFMVAEEIRELMAKLGFRTLNEMIGRSDLLEKRAAIKHWKAQGLDFSRLFHVPDVDKDVARYQCEPQDHGLDKAVDHALIKQAKAALQDKTPVQIDIPILNSNRSFGTLLSGELARRYGLEGLPDDSIHIRAKGTAGQSLGAWLAQGITIELAGEGNDYVGKGLSGGRIIIYPPKDSAIGKAEENIIAGNTVLYGAIKGECYLRGVAGERFCVRNSGATAIVEGVGDHGCEYMTGGVVVVLGSTGRNFAAGMSGGIAYVLDEDGTLKDRCNLAQVELEPVTEEDDALEALGHQGGDLETHGRVDVSHDMTRFDAIRLKQIIEQHMHYTDSPVARNIIDNWASYLPKFVKIMPVEYRRALQEMQQEQAATTTQRGL